MLPCSYLRSPGKISRLGDLPWSRWEFSQKRREREKTTRGKPVFPGIGPFLYFPGPLLYVEINVFSAYLCSYKGLTFVHNIFWSGDQLTFYGPTFLSIDKG